MIDPAPTGRPARNPRPRDDPARWRGSCSSDRAVSPAAKPPPSVLLLASPGAESEELFADLLRREDLCLLRVANAAAASRTVEEMPVSLVIASPDVPVAAIDAVLGRLERKRRGTPVLAVRERQAQEPAAWAERGVAVLRMPLLEGVLSRSVDVVLGMQKRKQER